MINKAIITGRLTKDIILKKTQSGLSTTSFTVATDRYTKAGEEKKADFISCQAWRHTAEYLANYGKKGSMIAIEGHIQTRTYDDKDGKKVYVTEIVVDNAQLFSSSENKTETKETKEEPKLIDPEEDLPF